ncbi:hypothetical protein [Oceanirhabdus sp. W0125-5]|nr:hypothetical protein [Oceanirhabdus sp. W0125-5]WBW98880.1 hypothetical protein OW730_09095 [Oceanirhabdus sp. W0125-5]
MKKSFLEKNNLATLLEYKLEYKEALKKIDQEAKRAIDNNRLFMGL